MPKLCCPTCQPGDAHFNTMCPSVSEAKRAADAIDAAIEKQESKLTLVITAGWHTSAYETMLLHYTKMDGLIGKVVMAGAHKAWSAPMAAALPGNAAARTSNASIADQSKRVHGWLSRLGPVNVRIFDPEPATPISRFAVPMELLAEEAQAVLVVDDNVVISSRGIKTMMEIWRNDTNRFLGLDCLSVTSGTHSSSPLTGGCDAATGRTMLFHRERLAAFGKQKEELEASACRHCPDLAFAAMMARDTRRGPRVLLNGRLVKTEIAIRHAAAQNATSALDCTAPERRRACALWLQQKYKEPSLFLAEPMEAVDWKLERSKPPLVAGVVVLLLVCLVPVFAISGVVFSLSVGKRTKPGVHQVSTVEQED